MNADTFKPRRIKRMGPLVEFDRNRNRRVTLVLKSRSDLGVDSGQDIGMHLGIPRGSSIAIDESMHTAMDKHSEDKM